MNGRLRQYSVEADALTRSEEILVAKIRIHDELGNALVATRYYLARGAQRPQPEALLEMWHQCMYITVYDSYFEPAGEDNWIGDYDFSAADNAVSVSTITSTDPLTVTLYGTYYDPNGTTATSDGFYWSMRSGTAPP